MHLSYTLWKSPNASPQADHWTFLHGMGGTGALWRPIAASLESDSAVLGLDQRGHGKSRIPAVVGGRENATYTPLDYGRDVVETLEALNFYPTFLVGHSMGVRTAVASAYLHPEGVRGLVLVDLGFSGVAGGGLGDDLGQFIRILPTEFNSRAEARAFMDASCPDPAIAQYLMAVSQADSTTGKVFFPFDHSALIATIEAARDSSVRTWVEALAQRQIPILALRGVKSLVWSSEEFTREREHFKRPEFASVVFEEFADAGHGLPFEKRTQFVERLRAFARDSA